MSCKCHYLILMPVINLYPVFYRKWLETCQFSTRSQPDLFSKLKKLITTYHQTAINGQQWLLVATLILACLGIDYRTVRHLKPFQFLSSWWYKRKPNTSRMKFKCVSNSNPKHPCQVQMNKCSLPRYRKRSLHS